MNAIPVFEDRFFSNSVTASMPPAEAPMATIGNGFIFRDWVLLALEAIFPAFFVVSFFSFAIRLCFLESVTNVTTLFL
jgi:hypothetical protein